MKTNLLNMVKSILLTGLFGIICAVSTAQPIDLALIEAGFVWETHSDSSNFNANANHGDMNVQYSPEDSDSREAYLKFDISGVSQIVTSANLKLVAGQKNGAEDTFGDKVWDDTSKFHIEVYGLTKAWSLDTLTWNNKLPVEGYPLDTFNVPGYGEYHLNSAKLMDYINGAVTSGQSEVSFVLKAVEPYTNSRAWVSNGLGWAAGTPILTVESTDPEATEEAAKDIWINEAEPSTNRNGSWDMGIMNADGASRHTYVAFNKGDLPDYAQEVYLQFFGKQQDSKAGFDPDTFRAQPDFIVEVYGCYNTDWDETTLTWDTEDRPESTMLPLAEINVNNIMTWYTTTDDRLVNYYNRVMANPENEAIAFILKAKEVSDTSRVWFAEKNWNNHAARLHASGLLRGSRSVATEDSYVDEAKPFENFNGEGDMHIALANGKNRMVYLKFDISGENAADVINFNLRGGQQKIGKALRDSFIVELYACEDKAWTEENIVWQTKPEITGDPLITFNILDGGWQSATSDDFKTYIESMINDGTEEITLALKAKYETFSATDSLRAWVISNVWRGGNYIGFYYNVSSNVGSPVFDPAPGVKTEDFAITMTTSTEGAEIYYTLDGSTPSASASKYTSPVDITLDMGLVTVRAITVKDGTRSEETTGEYVVADQKPYHGEPTELPAIVYAIAFDLGGPEVAYHTTANIASWSTLQDCRSDNAEINGVTEEDCSFEGGGFGNPSDGQWTEYTINVPDGLNCYNINISYGKAEATLDASVKIDLVNASNEIIRNLVDTFDMPVNCDDWANCPATVITVGNKINIPGGTQVIRVTQPGRQWNFGYMEFVPASGCTQEIESNQISKSIKVYPNPVEDNLHIRFNNEPAGAVKVTIYDITGKTMMRRMFESNIQSIDIPVNALNSGMYFLKIESDNLSGTERIMIRK